MNDEMIKHFGEIVHAVFFQTYEALQLRGLLTSTVNAVNHVTLLLLSDEQDIKYFNLKKYKTFVPLKINTHFNLPTCWTEFFWSWNLLTLNEYVSYCSLEIN